MQGARTVFGRDGFTRAGVDAIAKEAGVSTRTIYNHFPQGKAELFRLIVEEGTEQIVRAQLEVIDRWLHRIRDLEADLVDFGVAWAEPLTAYPDHFAVVRQMRAEIAHLPDGLRETWEAGPARVHQALADRFGALAEEGWLRPGDPGRTARHFLHLVGGEIIDRTYYGAFPLPRPETEQLVAEGVHTFLHGCLPRD
ncbi:TetR/AcrR family transcriptional regulator [Streptomyces albiaxialis]|uniref:TetR/AcrR family transcriptional regulator n=1 Tax=Streptomyces albiaxialis TaxID=329523 RepID=A0ABP5ILX3_9ACTN